MEKRKNLVLNDDVKISLENLEDLSKIIALSSLRNFEKFAYGNAKVVEKLHKQLQKDICHHSELDNYSDAYDLVQEASLFLLNFVGQKLGDTCTFIKSTAKAPQIIPIRMACFKTLFAYLRKEIKNGNTEDEEYLEFVPAKDCFEEDKVDYTKLKNIVRKITNNQLELQILEYSYNGVEVKDIAEFLNISIWKIYKQRRKFKDRYLAYCI